MSAARCLSCGVGTIRKDDGTLVVYHLPGCPNGPCRHETSLYGRCTDCGKTWEEQALELES